MRPAKAAKRRAAPPPVLWRLPRTSYDLALMYRQVCLESEPGSEPFETAVEALKGLPGYPGSADGDSSASFILEPIDSISNLRVH